MDIHHLIVMQMEIFQKRKTAMNNTKKFYRVSNEETQQGLWYSFDGDFTGNIHHRYNFCKHRNLAMDFDEEIIGFLSATPSLDELYMWFPKEDIMKLQKYGYYIHVFESHDHKFYEKFQHHVIRQSTAKLLEKIIL
jgi:hypothetical protein